jgi:large subunit ribosomal protein L32
MPNPKKRHSKARRNKRRANWRLEAPNLSLCPQCRQPKMPHRVCPTCGYYNDREVVPAAEA